MIISDPDQEWKALIAFDHVLKHYKKISDF